MKLLKYWPELLIAIIPTFIIAMDEILRSLDININTGIMYGYANPFLLLNIVFTTSLIVSAARDQWGWINHRWPVHCIRIALAFPVTHLIWGLFFSDHFVKRAADSDPFWDIVASVIILAVLLPTTLLLGLCVRLIVFPRSMPESLSFKKRIVKASICCLSLAFGFYVFTGGLAPRKTFDPDPDRFSNLSFTYDGKSIVFARKNGKQDTQIQTYDLDKEDLVLYAPPQGELWTMPRCSPANRQIVFVVRPPDEYRHPQITQIAVINTDGTDLRTLTNSTGYKANPALSYSRKTFIYTKDESMSGPGKYDVYESYVKTMEEKKITNFAFQYILNLQYFPDGKHYSFSGDGPTILTGVQGSEKQLYELKGRCMYVMSFDDTKLEPLYPLPQISRVSSHLLVDNKGEMFFCDPRIKGDGKKREDWQQWYAYSSDGKHRLIASIKAWQTTSAAISPDGNKLAVVYRTEPEDHDRIAIITVETGQRKELIIPKKPSRTISVNTVK